MTRVTEEDRKAAAEWISRWCEDDCTYVMHKALASFIATTRAEERGRCADIARLIKLSPDGLTNDIYRAYSMACEHIAKAIDDLK